MAKEWTPPRDASRKMARGVTRGLSGVFEDAGREAAGQVSVAVDFDFLLPAAKDYAEERGAEMIGMKWVDGELVENPRAELVIDKVTRDRARELVEDALEEGLSPADFASRLEEAGLFEAERAEMIARTETAIAYGRGKAATFREVGIDRVVIMDGDYDEECAERDGTTVSLEEWEANPTLHPNCTADARPLTREERDEEDEDEED